MFQLIPFRSLMHDIQVPNLNEYKMVGIIAESIIDDNSNGLR